MLLTITIKKRKLKTSMLPTISSSMFEEILYIGTDVSVIFDNVEYTYLLL